MTIKIRAAELGDYEAVRDTMAQPRAQAMTLQLPLPSLEMWKKRLAEAPDGDHALVAELDGKVVGNLGLHIEKRVRRRHTAAFGMAVHDDFQRRGVGSALMEAALNLADNWLNITRLELEVYTDNEPAIALYQKHGFEIEGTLKKHAFRDGKFVDSYYMARLKMT
jgi:L-phenylalanine/L-methionine N-acetyltransferase